MLEPAILYEDILQGLYIKAVFTDRFKFYSRDSGVNYFLPIYQNTGDMLQMVSVDNAGNVIGYFGVIINRETNAAHDLTIINFREKNPVFSADLHDFFINLYEKFGVNKVAFWVIVGNPAEKLYDNVIQAYGGRIVGTFKQDAKLYDGQLYDVKWYEILKDEFHHSGVDRFNWRNFRTEV